jgi:Putative MetA-pathway of phenol degradation
VLGAKSRSVHVTRSPERVVWIVLPILLVAATVVISTPDAVNADPQGGSPGRDAGVQQNGGESSSDYNGEDFTRPESKFETGFLGQTSGTTSRTDRETLLLRLDGAINLAADWKFGWLTQIPVVNKDTMAPNPADSTHDFGIGDAAFQGVLTQSINERWGYGFGARLVSPTAQDSLGSGKWQIMPGFGIRYSFFRSWL